MQFSHHKAVVYPWECWSEILVVEYLSSHQPAWILGSIGNQCHKRVLYIGSVGSGSQPQPCYNRIRSIDCILMGLQCIIIIIIIRRHKVTSSFILKTSNSSRLSKGQTVALF